MRPDPGLARQRVGDPRPARPLIVQRDTNVRTRPPLWQEHVLHGPVEAAGPAQSGHVPASRDDLRVLAPKHPAPVERTAIRATARFSSVEDLEASEHPDGLLAAAAEGPVPADPVAALDRHSLPASLHGSAGDNCGVPWRVDLVDALVRQPKRDKLADAVVADVPSDRAGALGQQLHDAQIGQRIDLQATQRARDHHSVEAGGMQLLDQGWRQALLTLDLLAISPQRRLQGRRSLHQGLRVDVCRQVAVFRYRVHCFLLPHSALQGIFGTEARDRYRDGSAATGCPADYAVRDSLQFGGVLHAAHSPRRVDAVVLARGVRRRC